MALFYRWKVTVDHRLDEIETWQDTIESRLEGVEEIARLVPELMERLGPETLTPTHQRQLQSLVKQLHDATGKPFATIYTDLYTAFSIPRYQDLPEAEWDNVEKWFKVQTNRARRKNS